jgi:hypothetical protein
MGEEISIRDNTLTATFAAPFTPAKYLLFIQSKRIPEARVKYHSRGDYYTVQAPARFATLLGVKEYEDPVRLLPISPWMFDYQRFIVPRALAAERYAIWADCGLGKTLMFLEWAIHVQHITGDKVLIFSPLSIIAQTVEEYRKYYGATDPDITVLPTREAMEEWCKQPGPGLAICNPEKMIPGVTDALRYLGGLVIDESSLLKTGGGVIKWNIIKSARGIRFKLSCTATPAPNDTMEYASQAAFLEKLRNEGEILWTYFQRDKAGNWFVKPHAKAAFYQFMATWSIYLRRPALYGWQDNFSDVPPPLIREIPIEMTPAQADASREFIQGTTGEFFADEKIGVTLRNKLSQIAKGFLYDKPKPARRILSRKPLWVAKEIEQAVKTGRQTLVWTEFDEETEIILKCLGEYTAAKVAVLSGKVKPAARAAILEDFRTGKTPVLISKAKLLGYGLNFPFCTLMIFSGFSDSYENFYQALRRAYRYGATQQLEVLIPYIQELEGKIYSNIVRKKAQFEQDCEMQEKNYLIALEALRK